jgi:hypothetical protein
MTVDETLTRLAAWGAARDHEVVAAFFGSDNARIAA